LKIDRYMLRGVWQALNYLSIVIIAGESPVEGRFADKTITRDSKNSTVTPANTGHADRILTTDNIFKRLTLR